MGTGCAPLRAGRCRGPSSADSGRHGAHGASGAWPKAVLRTVRTVAKPSCRAITTAILVAAFLTCRVGEALHPGPAGAVYEAEPKVQLVDASWKRAVAYPPPHRDGFRDIASPGFVGRQGEGDR
jgi:hypothetical protein